VIGKLETEVLSALRELDEAPARTVQARLGVRGNRVAYTTVATSLARLFDKGFVRRRRQTCRGGERYVYQSVDFERAYLRDMLKGVVTLFGPSGVVHLNQELAKLHPTEERELRRRLGL
jgi:predicted transcriptional regulator